MKKLITLCLMLIAFSGMSQVWQSIGTTIGASVSHQDLFIDQASGDIYVAYVESVGQRAMFANGLEVPGCWLVMLILVKAPIWLT
ncbi:MAG: hypothetical protein IPG07_16180 [Crocinitomicaceae bacterium]|nr:hypothetical protein [Crocinitomicaceae bacterium]